MEWQPKDLIPRRWKLKWFRSNKRRMKREKSLQDIISCRVDMDAIIHSDGWRGYN